MDIANVPSKKAAGHPEVLNGLASSVRAVPDSPDIGRPAKIALWAIGLGFGGFLLWAGFAPLDEGVPAQAVVSIDTKRKTVQHLSGGIVREVLVKEGDRVQEGQPLFRLDDAVSRANFESVRQRYLGFRAMEGRLLAERQGQSTITFHPDVQKLATQPQVSQQILTQQQLFQSRRSSLQADLRAIEESIQGQQALIQAYQSMNLNRRNQMSLLQEELGNTRELVKEGYAPRNRQLELERMVAESNSSLAELQGNATRAEKSILELRQRSQVRQQEYKKEVESQLTDVSRELQADDEKLRAVTNDLDRTEIRATASGQVVGLAVQTVGAVVQAGQKLMDIVPENETLILEARVPPHVIDRLKPNLPVDIRFSAFANSPQLVVNGEIASISGDLITEPQTNISYYLARVVVTPEGIKRLGKRQMHPGMPAEVVLKTGERSMLTYLLHPLTKRLAASMTEQ